MPEQPGLPEQPAQSGGRDLVDVRLVGIPLALQRRAAEHGDELMREFRLILELHKVPDESAPARLLAVASELQSDYGPFTEEQEAELAAAFEAGALILDLAYRVPPSVADAARHLGSLLDEADAFCRQERLLTLETPAELVAYRRWFLDEFIRQIAGEPPRAWSEQGTPPA
ncbi:MAG: hypothetical protein ACRDYD_13270 [Acidimicrobiales bacterium]